MANANLFEQVQLCLDGMSEALQQCMAEDISGEEMWTAIDTHCFRLSKLSDANGLDEDEDEEDDGDDREELRFGEDEEIGHDFGDDDEDEDA